jgi:Na+/melibiose symporter-like transporter
MPPALTFNTKFSYGIGQLAEGLKNSALSTFVLFYYNQVLGLSGTLAGTAIFIAFIFDAVTDPLAGSISDNWRSRWGRRHPFMYASAIPLGIAFFLLFSPPDGLSEWSLFLWLTVTVVLTRAAMTLYHVPHIALGAELSDDYDERTQIVSYRYFLGFAGYLVAYYLGFGVFFSDSVEFPRGQFNVDAYAPYALVLAFTMAATVLWSAWGTHNRIPYLPVAQADAQAIKLTIAKVFTRMFGEIMGALRNRSFAWLFAGTMIIFVMVGVDGALNLYLFEFFWELSSAQKLNVLLVYPVGIMAGTFIAPVWHRHFNKRSGVVFGGVYWALCQIVPILLRFIGAFPENGTEPLVITLMAVKLTQGIAAAQFLVSFNSMVADIADEHELATGKRQEGIFFAAVSFANKTTVGLGSLIGGVGLDLIDWPTQVQHAADIPAEKLGQLGLLYGPLLAGFAVVSVLCVLQNKSTREGHQQVVRQLAALRKQNDEYPDEPAQGPTKANTA